MVRKDFPIKGWKWIFYVIGWITGALNVLFWLIMYMAHLTREEDTKFINNNFHKRVYYWGIAMTIINFIYAIIKTFILY